jgi:hypothetical protein
MNSSLGVALALALAGLAQPLAAAPAQTPDAAAASEPVLSKAQIYGVIEANGTVLPGSRGILVVTNPQAGFYCVLPSSLTLQKAVASGALEPQVALIRSSGTVAPWPSTTLCPSTAYIGVQALGVTGAANNVAFVISFD